MNPFNLKPKGELKVSRKFLEEKDWEKGGVLEDEDTRPSELRFEFKRFGFFKGLVIICFLVLGWRLFSLQILGQKLYQQEAEGNRMRTFSISAPRGIIYDRNSNLLVRNIPSFDLIFIPADLPREEKEKNELITTLAGITGMALPEIKMAFQKSPLDSFEPKVLVHNLERERALILETKLSSLPGVSLIKTPLREYLEGEILSHILGYTGKISEEEYETKKEQGYFLTDWIGKQGVEYVYEEKLRGKNGREIVEVDSRGRIKKVIGVELPEAGKSLKLSLDLELERKLGEEVKLMLDKVGSGKGAAIAFDPRRGEILALVSFPAYNHNLLAQGISEKELEGLNNDPYKPLFNRVTGGRYPPGSIIKPLIATAALEEGVITSNHFLNCPGSLVYKGWGGTVWHFGDWKAHGATDIRKAIAESCNVFFYVVGGGSETYGLSGLGIEKIKKWGSKFGLDSILGVDLSGEESSFIPYPAWKEENKKEKWYIGDTYHVSIGQGDILVTPLQIASITATIANRGILYKPKIGYKIIDEETQEEENLLPQVLRENFVNPQNLEVVRQGMREAVIYGSARALKDLPVEAAGKTGTAQFSKGEKTHAWFTCFAPYDNPEIVLTILIEEGGEGDKVAVPIAKNVLEWYFRELKER